MPRSTSPVVLSDAQLRRGYELSIDNALRLAGAATAVLDEYPDKALALAQLGQEELGKSLSLLASGALPQEPDAWTWLWDGWRDHQLKAHRAYLYEIIHPLRIILSRPEYGERYEGEPLLDRLVTEKEIGFYVDYDRALGAFVSPQELVDHFAATARTSTVMYLAATADAVRRAILHDDYIYRFKIFAEVAFTICSKEVYQQDWPAMRAAFAATSPRHKSLIDDLDLALRETADFFRRAVGATDANTSSAQDIASGTSPGCGEPTPTMPG
jgi:AbiV family abortive infection protein